MKKTMLKYICLGMFALLFSTQEGVVASGSDRGDVMLSYDVVEKGTADKGRTTTLTVRVKIKNIGENAIDKVTAYVRRTKGIAVDFDHVFFGLIESGETLTSEELDLVLETGNSPNVQPGMVWDVEYETRYGTASVVKVPTYLQQDPDWCPR